MINEDVRYIVEAELREGEELLWADKPEGIAVEIYDILGMLFYTFFIISIIPLLYPQVGILYYPQGEILYPILIDMQEFKYFYLFFHFILLTAGFWLLRIVLNIVFRTRHIYAITSYRVIAKTSVFHRKFYQVENFQRVDVSKTQNLGVLTFVPKGETDLGLLWLNLEKVGIVYRGLFWSHEKDKLTKFYRILDADFVAKLVKLTFLTPEKNENPGFTTSRRSRRRRRSML